MELITYLDVILIILLFLFAYSSVDLSTDLHQKQIFKTVALTSYMFLLLYVISSPLCMFSYFVFLVQCWNDRPKSRFKISKE